MLKVSLHFRTCSFHDLKKFNNGIFLRRSPMSFGSVRISNASIRGWQFLYSKENIHVNYWKPLKFSKIHELTIKIGKKHT